MAERVTIFKLRDLARLIADKCDMPIEISTEAKRATIAITGYRDGVPARVIVCPPCSIREAYHYLQGAALGFGIELEPVT